MTEDPRISEIRAVLAEVVPQTNWGMTAGEHVALVAQQRVQRIRAILDRPAPAPRVWFPGETVPAGVAAADCNGFTSRVTWDWMTDTPVVEVPLLTRAELQAAVDQARDEREGAVACGRPDDACGQRGGSAGCGGCRG